MKFKQSNLQIGKDIHNQNKFGKGLFFTFYLIFWPNSCKREGNGSISSIQTGEAFCISVNSASVTRSISSEGGSPALYKGICWATIPDVDTTKYKTDAGADKDTFIGVLTNLGASNIYYAKAYALNSLGIGYGNEITFTTLQIPSPSLKKIIADHTIVGQYDKIPVFYINEVKKMWVSIIGDSYSQAYRTGCELFEALNGSFQLNVTDSGTPEAYTTSHHRICRGSCGVQDNSSLLIYNYGEKYWNTNSSSIARTKACLLYCKNNGPTLTIIGFGWFWDTTWINGVCGSYDPLYFTRWAGSSDGGPKGNLRWGLDTRDQAFTCNIDCMGTYINAT